MTAGPTGDLEPLRGFDPVTYRPRVVLWWAVALSCVLIGAAALGWAFIGPDVRAGFTVVQVLWLIMLIGLIIGVMFLLALSNVTLTEWGIVARNGLMVQRWAWYQVDGVRFREGDPWASVLFDTPDGIVRRPLIGVQRTDSAQTVEAVAEIRRRLEASRAQGNQP